MRFISAVFRCLVIGGLVVASFGCDNQTAQDHLQSARDSLANGESRVAVIELKNAIQKDSSLGEARALLGQLHFRSGDLASALKELERAVDLGVSNDATQLSLLRTKNGLGRYSEVLGELEERERLEPEYAVVLADAYLIAGDIERAKPLLQQGLHLPDGLFGMARVAQLENDPERAYSYLKQLDDCFKQISENPELGLTVDFITDGYRKFPQGSHLIFYKLSEENTVEIIRVLHKSMDVESKF